MNPSVPMHISVIFAFTTLLTVFLFYRAAANSKTVLWVLLPWLALQAAVSLTGFYLDELSVPPRMALLAGPALLFIAALFLLPSGRRFLDSLSLKAMTGIHVVRILVEGVLYALMVVGAVPEVMTFAGRNFDIVAGLAAPLAVFFGFRNTHPRRGLLVAYHVISLGLLANIVTLAILSAPTPLQRMAFEQPNVAILYFPFSWLPCCVVPLVLLSHLAALRQLAKPAGD
jgi:hypothetical protein